MAETLGLPNNRTTKQNRLIKSIATQINAGIPVNPDGGNGKSWSNSCSNEINERLAIFDAEELAALIVEILSETELDGTPKPISSTRLALIKAVGYQVGIFGDNGRLFNQIQSMQIENEKLHQAIIELQKSENFYAILDVVRKYSIIGQTQHFISIDLYDQPWNGAKMPEWATSIARWGSLPAEISSERYLLRSLLSSTQFVTPDAVTYISDMQNESQLDINIRTLYTSLYQAQSMVYAPLVISKQWIGHVIAFYRYPTYFNEVDIQRMYAIASQAAVTIQKLRH